MRVFAKIYQNHKTVATARAASEQSDPAEALMECLEQVYKELDMAEPVWVSKHAAELSRYGHTKFFPEDFVEPVSFDYFEIEFLKN